jgi:hypothetical protein
MNQLSLRGIHLIRPVFCHSSRLVSGQLPNIIFLSQVCMKSFSTRISVAIARASAMFTHTSVWTAVLVGCVGVTSLHAQISVPNPSFTYSENFSTLANTGTSSTVPAGWAFAETGASANALYTAGTGSSNTGDTYSLGLAANTERAFGGLQSGSVTVLPTTPDQQLPDSPSVTREKPGV